MLRSCSEVAPGVIGRSAEAVGASPAASAWASAYPRQRSDKVRQGPTRSDKVRQRSDTARRGARREPGAAPSIAKYRQVSPGAAFAARPRRDGKTFAGRGHGTWEEAAPSQVSPSIARVPHLEDGTMAATGGPLSSGGPTPAQAPRGLSRRSAARKGPAKSLHSPRARGRWRERRGLFAGSLTRPSPALPRQAGRSVFSQVSLAEKSAPFFRVSARKFFGFRRRHAPSFLTCRA